ncbi:aldo/keto reductase [Kiloniella antarctica]|uniref:Aldo/keto reductase n=1 Tax=Kiloniella antarctica TaxID=1550907 RepID=A0ABW5BPM4_9PROT
MKSNPLDRDKHFRSLGNSGLMVSSICLGTMMFGGRTDNAHSMEIISSARETGLNFIDTADVYNEGRSEEIVGQSIKGDRDYWVLATKVANQMQSDPQKKGLSRRWIMRAVEASLSRLKTDFIDIYYLHREDHGTPLLETVQTMGDLIRSGKIRYFGLSNYRGWRIAEICRLCDQLSILRPIVCQPYYNALNRQPEVEVLPSSNYYGLGVVPYSPLARGVLTGKYLSNVSPDKDSRAGAADKRMMETEWRPESLEIVQRIKHHCEKKGYSPVDFAIGWLLANQYVSSILAGPRTLEQFQGYLSALSYPYDAEDEELLNGLVAAGHASTPGYTDPSYPLEGRKVDL